jgi:hypothetical protein
VNGMSLVCGSPAPSMMLKLRISSRARLPRMRLSNRFASPGFEQKLQEALIERQAETRRVKGLSELLAKKVASAKMKRRSAGVV